MEPLLVSIMAILPHDLSKCNGLGKLLVDRSESTDFGTDAYTSKTITGRSCLKSPTKKQEHPLRTLEDL